MRLRPVGPALLIGILAWPAAAVSAPAQGFVLTGRLTGVPAQAGKSRRGASIRVVRVETAEVAAVKRLPRSMAYRVVLPAGPYVVVGTVADVPGSRRYSGVSRLVRAGVRGHRRLDLRVTRQRTRAMAAGTPARTAEAVQYVGVTPSMPVAGSDVPPKAIGWMLQTSIGTTPCPSGKRLQLIEVEHRQRLRDEIKLSQSKWADPATRLTNRLISPRYMVRGGGTQSGGTMRMSLSMVDVKTGRTVAKASVSGPADSFFELYDELQRALIADACKEDGPPFHYRVLDASFQTQAAGTQTGTMCSMAGLASGGTRDFSGVMAPQPVPPASKLEALPGSSDVAGSIAATVAATWTNDHLDGCRFGDEDLVACSTDTPPRTPQPGGTWTITYGIDVQPLGSTVSGHWSVPTAEIGFVSGGADPGCMFTSHISGNLSRDEVAQSYPASVFTATGPQTITFSGSRHFTETQFGGGSELDYRWTYTIVFERVDADGRPL